MNLSGLKETVEQSFRLITTTLLSLLLPLSFLFISRLSSASFFFSLIKSQQTSSFDLLPAVLYVVVSLITVCTLILGFTTKIIATETNPNNSELSRMFHFLLPHVSIAWIILFVVQISVGLGLKETALTGLLIGGSTTGFLSKLVFFFGLHEVMLLWSRVIVKPVVDNTLGGGGDRRTVVERVALAVSCGSLWWWKLRDEIEGLVGVVEAKRALLLLLLPIEGKNGNNGLEVGILDFVNWWLYYMVVVIGMVRIVKGCLWFGMVLLFEQGDNGNNSSRGRRRDSSTSVSHVSMESIVHFDDQGDDNKV